MHPTNIAETPDFVIVGDEPQHSDVHPQETTSFSAVSPRRKVWTAILMLFASVAGFAGAYALDSLNDVRSSLIQTSSAPVRISVNTK